ncbi:MAG: retroviral-like aspartic protease family protein [Prevotellaceae bacterium]|jgi:predicted aspartyl protease|nr:retroviral-like aspartic protease family protein [Prevotellaceae bacterium]
MKTILLLPAIAFLLFCACGTEKKTANTIHLNEDTVRLVLQDLSEGFRTGDIGRIQKCVAERFSISVSMGPSSRRYLEPVLKRNPIQNIGFVAIDSLYDDMATVKVKVEFTDNKPETESIVAFDGSHKIIFIDYLDRLYGTSRYDVSVQKAVVPFEFEEGYIVVPLKLNNNSRVLRFLFDTGADGMAVDKALADSLNLSITSSQTAEVVGGRMQIDISSGNTVRLTEDFALENQNIAVFNNIGHGLDGIIGLNLAMNYITNVNFDKRQISLHTYGDYRYEGEGEIVKIKNNYNVTTITGVLNIVGKEDVTGDFIFDSGANYDLIAFSGFVRKNRLLLTGFKPEEQSSTVSMGHSTPVFEGKAHRFAFSPNLVFSNIPITLQASTSRNDDEKTPSGSIGINLIRNFNFTINLLEKEIFFSAAAKAEDE